ncbi:MAG: hypothetical protein ACYTHK_07315 [Planctomycetota bacterium]
MAIALVLLLFHPHSAPTLWVDAVVESGQVELLISIRADHADAWVQGGLPAADLVDFITKEEHAIALEALDRYFARYNRVYIDGEAVAPKALAVSTPEDAEGREMIDYLAFRLAYRCEGWPRKVQIAWEDFEAASFQNEPIVPGTIRVGPQVESMAFTPEEPKFTWAYPETGLPERATIEPIEAPQSAPWIAHLLIGVAAVGGILGLLRAGAGATSWLLLGLLIGGSAWALPWDPRANPVITQNQARVVFEQLLRNVYRSFEVITEEESYDLLAYSLEPELTKKLYLEVREGLVMRDQGGAIADVGNIERRGGSIEFTGAREFKVRWRWWVFAHITHWGHTHSRINEYLGDFVVRAGPQGWRITEYEVLDMQRVPTEEK